jgi:hypothetical protein
MVCLGGRGDRVTSKQFLISGRGGGKPYRVTEVDRAVVIARLDAIFPGSQSPHATLRVETVIERAKALGAEVTSRPVDARGPAALVLGDLPSRNEDVFVVSDTERCLRVPAERLEDFVTRGREVAGEVSFDGDALFVCTTAKRVVVRHHEGFVFDLVDTSVPEPRAVCNACLHLRDDLTSAWIREASEGRPRTTYYCDDDFAFVGHRAVVAPTACPHCANTSVVVPVDEATAEGIARFASRA